MVVNGRWQYYGPRVHVVWRNTRTIGAVLGDTPRPHTFNEDTYLPEPCVLHPEQVGEFQDADLLPAALREQVKDADERWAERGIGYQYDLSIAPGCKAVGWASWHLTNPWNRTCTECGSEFELLLKLDSREWDGILSWKPIEDDRRDHEAQCPTGLTHGRWGELRIFTCAANLTHPFELNIQ
jgi:hypothetical protein